MSYGKSESCFTIVCDIVYILTMGDAEVTTPQESTGENAQNSVQAVTGELSRPKKEIRRSEHCNGHDVYLKVGNEHMTQTTPGNNMVPAARQGTQLIGNDNEPLDTTVSFTNINISASTGAEQNEVGSSDGVKRTRFPRLSLRASFSHRGNKKRCINMTKRFISSPFGVFCLILLYLCLGASIFMWMERAEEAKRRTTLIEKRYELTKELTVCQDNNSDPTECLYEAIKKWEKNLLGFPLLYIHLDDNNSSEPQIWNWANAFYGCFSIITTIGYGTIAPITPWGRLYAVFYAIVGIPLMLLLVADIGGQLARMVKIAIIAVRKRRQRKTKFWKKKRAKEKSNHMDYTDDEDSPRRSQQSAFDLKGHENLGLEEDGDFNENQAKLAHINGVNLHLEVTGRGDSDSSYSSCSNCDDQSDEGGSPSRKRRKYVRKGDYGQRSSAVETAKGNANRGMKRTISDTFYKENINSNQTGIRIEIDYGESDDNKSNENGLDRDESGVVMDRVCHRVDPVDSHQNCTDLQLYDALGKSASDCEQPDMINLPKCDQQYDSISQCSTQFREISDQSENTHGMLDVPRSASLTYQESSIADTATDDGIASVSSIHTTASNAPTEIYKSDLEVPRVSIKSPNRTKSGGSVTDERVPITSHNNLPVIRIEEAIDSDVDHSRPSSPSILRKQSKRRTSQISCVSINVEPQEIEIPPDYRGRAVQRAVRKRKTGSVNFGAAMGSFSSVSENDIALFSIPLWLALLLLFVYLLIGASCYSLMEGWSAINSFYYAFISLSTIGFGDLYFVPESFEGALIFNFIYCFIGLSFVSMVWSLSSREFTLLAKKIARNLGYYKSRRWRQTVKGWTNRMKKSSFRRWSSRRRNAMKVPPSVPRANSERSSGSSSSDDQT